MEFEKQHFEQREISLEDYIRAVRNTLAPLTVLEYTEKNYPIDYINTQKNNFIANLERLQLKLDNNKNLKDEAAFNQEIIDMVSNSEWTIKNYKQKISDLNTKFYQRYSQEILRLKM